MKMPQESIEIAEKLLEGVYEAVVTAVGNDKDGVLGTHSFHVGTDVGDVRMGCIMTVDPVLFSALNALVEKYMAEVEDFAARWKETLN